MSKTLVAYFSASGQTERLAKNIAEATSGDLFEIKPLQPYTSADLNWQDKNSRSSIEMSDHSSRPEVASIVNNINSYDTVLLGFPIWWYVAPTIINTFLEQYDFSGKTIIPFATSGGSGMGKTNNNLKNSCKGAKMLNGKVFRSNADKSELSAWIEGLLK